MPGMDGNELIRNLHEIDTFLPIVMCTGHITLGDDEEITSIGAAAVIKKPIRLKELSVLLKSLTSDKVS